jgi:hypothetical protein
MTYFSVEGEAFAEGTTNQCAEENTRTYRAGALKEWLFQRASLRKYTYFFGT